MRKQLRNIGLISVALMLSVAGSSMVFDLIPQADALRSVPPSVAQPNTANPQQQAPSNSNKQRGVLNSAPPHTNSAQPSSSNSISTANKLRACQNRENAINNIMSRIDIRATNQVNLFSKIASRVEAFYTKQGKTVSNYATLVVSITSAKNKALQDLTTLKTNDHFVCNGSNPREAVLSFQGYLKTAISDLKNYKMTVKNLIVAVAAANNLKISGTQTTPAVQTSTKGGN